MTSKPPMIRLIALVLLAMVVVSACAAGDPAPVTDASSAQPAATGAPAAAQPTEAPAVVEPTAAPAAVAPTEEAVAAEPAEVPATEAPAAAGEERTFTIDPANTVISYEVDEEFGSDALNRLGVAAGLTKTIGRTSTVDGSLTLEMGGAVPQLKDASFTVDISTLTSNQRMRDRRIQGEWLESSRFPTATFNATEIQVAPATYSEGDEVTFQVAGDLTVREVTNPVVFDVTATLDGNTITGVATSEFQMSSFGVSPPRMANLFTVGDDTVIRVEFVAQAQ